MIKINLKRFPFILGIAVIVQTLQSCKENAADNPNSENGKLYAEVNDNNFVFYKNEDKILSPKGNSPHGEFRLRFNNTALASLDSTGKLPVGGAFGEGSIVLKEIMSGNKVTDYIVMKKSSGHVNAKNNWLWYGFKKDGKLRNDPADQGKDCAGCHAGGGNRDQTLSFTLHP